MSKLRYGLQLCSEVRLTNEDKKSFIMKELQLTQNRMLRSINNSKIKDKISIESMLDKFNLPSVNQLAATIKLQEVWKSINVPGCPIKLEPYKKNVYNQHELRTSENRIFKDTARLKMSNSSFNINAAKVWNAAPQEIKNASSMAEAKRCISKYAKSLPI